MARRVVPGTARRDEPGGTINCLLLAPGPDWVAMDLATGSFVRAEVWAESEFPALSAGPLSSVSLQLATLSEQWDPARPEAISVAEASEAPAPKRRAVQRLLESACVSRDSGGLLGSVAPSLSFVDLDGSRPSVALVAPGKARVRVVGEDRPVAHFLFGDRPHAIDCGPGAIAWLHSGQLATAAGGSTAKRRENRSKALAGLGPGIELAPPVFLVVGLDRPVRGQVRKVVLGIVPSA